MGLLRLSHERPEVTPDVSVRETSLHHGRVAHRGDCRPQRRRNRRDLQRARPHENASSPKAAILLRRASATS